MTTGHKDYIENNILYNFIACADKEIIIIDTVGLLKLDKLPAYYSQNKNFFVLGVGHREE